MKKYTIHLDPDAVDEIVLTELKGIRDCCLREIEHGISEEEIQFDKDIVAACDALIEYCGGN